MNDENNERNNTINHWAQLVLKQLENDEACIRKLEGESRDQRKCITDLKIKITKLEMKSGFIWGILGGAVPTLVGLIIWLTWMK